MLVAADAMAGLDPHGASEMIARAFADTGAQVVVVPLSDGGRWFAASVKGFQPGAVVSSPTSVAEVVGVLTSGESVSFVDLTAVGRHSWDELVAIGPAQVEIMRVALAGRQVVAVVRNGTQDATLTGLTGVVAERARHDGGDLGDTLVADAKVSRWRQRLGVEVDAPGGGAADGLGTLILALGGRIASGLEVCVEGFNLVSTMTKADLVVTGSAELDFHAVGGDVVKEVARLGGEALRPVIAVVGRNFVSSRELRLAGIESAHAILDGAGPGEPTGPQVLAVAGQVAHSWSW